MVLVEDKIYHETLDILRGKIELLPLFKELKAFIQLQYGATVYNFVFRKMKLKNPRKQYNLYILLATTEDFRKMFSGYNYSDSIQKEIANRFNELANQYNYSKPKLRQDVFVSFNDFSNEMKTDANWKAIKKASRFIQDKYASYNVWGVHAAFGSSVVFFLSNEDLKKGSSIKREIEDDYFYILKKQDEFNLFSRSCFSLEFDSKENLDVNYEGNLFYYFR